jgi:hypothetical protein
MRKEAFNTICVVRTVSEGEEILAVLREAGLHPADLSLATLLPIEGGEESFPIQVPTEETDAARDLLEGHHSVSQRPTDGEQVGWGEFI